MNTRIMPADPAGIRLAASILKAGRPVVFPTETVYGLGADALRAEAVALIFEAKGRPHDNPLIAHIDHAAQAEHLAHVDARCRLAMEAFWPGPLTLIMKKRDCVPDAVTAGLDTVAVRLPAHPAARALIGACGFPIAAPSANRSGRPSPTRALDAFEEMDGRVELVLDGGDCSVGLESTVLDMTRETPVVLRPGGVTTGQLREALGCPVELHAGALAPLEEARPASPGIKYTHYAPEGRVLIVRGERQRAAAEIIRRYDAFERLGGKAGILCSVQSAPLYGPRTLEAFGSDRDIDSFAFGLFASLRALERAGARLLLCEAVPAQGLGVAVMNRLLRAASFEVIDAGQGGDA